VPLEFQTIWPYVLLTVSSFGAATLLPFSSELILVAQLKSGLGSPIALLTAATLGNVAGSCFNWWLGMNARRYEDRRWFPFTADAIDRAGKRFSRYGLWTLLLAWLPVVGDPLTFVAGILRVPFVLFLPLVAAGKAARYALLVYGLS
jgi:membrane protein YqaA with SNARE-associated domain